MGRSAVDEAEANVGRTLRGKWRLDSLIDVGGMAAVYAGTHRNGLRGAVKILQHGSPESAERFRREGYIANHVDHPAAVRVLDDDTDEDGHPFLVMELLSGAALHERAAAKGGALGEEEVLLVIDQLLDLLIVAHERGVIHRDIKPENLFLTHEGRLKLLDFGIASLKENKKGWRTQTVEGITMGTPAFMSPEQARGRWDLVGEQSDLWSVGATMFTLLSGEYVHEEETPAEMLAASFTKAARSLAAVRPRLHPAVVAIVDRALLRSLADRWPDARSMRAAVRDAHVAMFRRPLPSVPDIRVSSPGDGKGARLASPNLEASETMQATATALPASPAPRRGRRLVASAALLAGALVIAIGASGWHARQAQAWQATGPAALAGVPAAGGEPSNAGSPASPAVDAAGFVPVAAHGEELSAAGRGPSTATTSDENGRRSPAHARASLAAVVPAPTPAPSARVEPTADEVASTPELDPDPLTPALPAAAPPASAPVSKAPAASSAAHTHGAGPAAHLSSRDASPDASAAAAARPRHTSIYDRRY